MRPTALVPALLAASAGHAAAQTCNPSWLVRFAPAYATSSGAPSSIFSSLVFDDDGPGPHGQSLFVAGPFSNIGGVAARSIARWDGRTWSPLGDGIVLSSQTSGW